jgi:hypothetical protein
MCYSLSLDLYMFFFHSIAFCRFLMDSSVVPVFIIIQKFIGIEPVILFERSMNIYCFQKFWNRSVLGWLRHNISLWMKNPFLGDVCMSKIIPLDFLPSFFSTDIHLPKGASVICSWQIQFTAGHQDGTLMNTVLLDLPFLLQMFFGHVINDWILNLSRIYAYLLNIDHTTRKKTM